MMLLSHNHHRQIRKFMNGLLAVLAIYALSGCQQTAAAPATAPDGRQDLFLGIVAFILFLMTLIFAGYKTFARANTGLNESDKAESRARAAAFVVGILITVIIIAADADNRSVLSVTRLLGLFPWFLLTILGAGFGFVLAIGSYMAARYRPTSGYEFIILTLTICGSLGLYLALSATGLRHNVLAGITSILVGLLLFRMLFPVGPKSPNQVRRRAELEDS